MALHQILENFSEVLEPGVRLLLQFCDTGDVHDFLQNFLDFLEFVPFNVFCEASQEFFGSVGAKLEQEVLVNLEHQGNGNCTSSRSCVCKQLELRQGLAQLSSMVLESLIGATMDRLEEHLH